MKARFFGLVSLAVLFCGSHADAQQQMTDRPTMNYGQWYGGLEAGVIVPDDISYSVVGAGARVSGNLSFDAGAAVGGFLGYHFNDYLAGEAEFLYGNNDFDKLTFSGPVTGSGTATLNGSVDSETFLASAIVTPFGRGRFAPYIGGSLGFMNHDASITSFSVPGGTFALNLSDSGLNFAAGAVVGFDWAATPRWSLGARYRFLWSSLDLGCSAGFACSNDDFTAHIFTANASYRF